MKKKGNSLRTVWFFLKPYKTILVFLCILSVTAALLETTTIAVLYPILTSGLEIQPGQNASFFLTFVDSLAGIIPIADPLIAASILFILLAALAFLFRLLYVFLSVRVASRIVVDNQQKVFEKFTNSDYQFFIDNKQGELLYKASRAPSFIAMMLTIITKSAVEIALAITILVLLFSISWLGTILVMIVGMGYYLFAKYLSAKVSYVTGVGRYEAGQRQNVVLNEYITGAKQIKVFQTTPYWKAQFGEAAREFWNFWRKDSFWLEAPPLMLSLLLFTFVGVMVVMVRIQNPGSFASVIPAFGTFAFGVYRLLPRLSSFGHYRMQFMGQLPNIEAVSEILKDETYHEIEDGREEFVKLNSGIEFKNVKFAYKTRDIVLDDVSLKIEKDKTTAIVGATGSGKSTIVDLLLRIYDVDQGGIYIDGKNIKEYNIASILRKIGFVGQETFIHNASVKDNIAFGNEYTMAEIVEAAKVANAHEFIQQFPQGYDTQVGDRGLKLSGGERQRIAIARAMIRKPDVLILDEATSALDNVSEKMVQDAVSEVAKKCTTLIIAHRLSTIQNADKIYVLDQGRIVESGTHDQLMDQKGKYWSLYNLQAAAVENSRT